MTTRIETPTEDAPGTARSGFPVSDWTRIEGEPEVAGNEGEAAVQTSPWRTVWTAPFRALRAIYWMMDPDAQVRSQGEQTIGTVTDRRTQVTVSTDSECGDETTTYTHYVSYRFDIFGTTWSREQKVQALGGIQKGDRIVVYYLPGIHPLRHATDPRPKRYRTPAANG